MKSFPWDARSDELLLSLRADEYGHSWDQIAETISTKFTVNRTKMACMKRLRVLKRRTPVTRSENCTLEDLLLESEPEQQQLPPQPEQQQLPPQPEVSTFLKHRIARHLEALMGSETKHLKTFVQTQFEGRPLSRSDLANAVSAKRADGLPRFIRVQRGHYRVNTAPIQIRAKTKRRKRRLAPAQLNVDQLVVVVRQYGGIANTLTTLLQAKQLATKLGGLEKAITTITTLKKLS